jgi:hypothetical protein
MAYGNGYKGSGESRRIMCKRKGRNMKRYSNLYTELISTRGAISVKTDGDRSYTRQTATYRSGGSYITYNNRRYSLKSIKSFKVYRGDLQIIFKR